MDHTWVTTYDSRVRPFQDLKQVVQNRHQYWFCWGRFWRQGKPPDPIVITVTSATSSCLVLPNDKSGKGTIQWYGIHGVCHQVSNQVLYPTRQHVRAARGYKLSSAIWNSYGIRDQAWRKQLENCLALATDAPPPRRFALLLYSRARYHLGRNSPLPRRLEELRRALLSDLASIGFAPRTIDESKQDRTEKLNRRIWRFLRDAARLLEGREAVYEKLFGITLDTPINLIDPELFEFPQVSDED